MKYKHLFIENHFVFNGTPYYEKSYAQSFFKLTEDILNEKHGKLPSGNQLKSMFGETIKFDEKNIPPSFKRRKGYRKLGDIYVMLAYGKEALNSKIKTYSEFLKVNAEF
jgi:hypothetical protein